MPSVLSVDLAHSSYPAIGTCLLDGSTARTTARFLGIELSGKPDPEVLAVYLDKLATSHGARLLLLDGPQGWKCSDLNDGCSKDVGKHSRLCERQANCPGKTGHPGQVKPKGYTNFMTFCVDVFGQLVERGWSLYDGQKPDRERRYLIETFPLAAWRTLGLPYLRAKRKATAEDIKNRLEDLRGRFPELEVQGQPDHDQLQALVSGMAGVQLVRGGPGDVVMFGRSPHVVDEIWREGFILCPTPPRS